MKSRRLQLSLFTIIIIFSTASQCCDDSFPEGRQICKNGETPTWIAGIISSIQESGHKGEIIQYQYKGKPVFWINRCLNCTDAIVQVYDCQQNEICLFGGIAGSDTCPDFSQKATNKKVVWEN